MVLPEIGPGSKRCPRITDFCSRHEVRPGSYPGLTHVRVESRSRCIMHLVSSIKINVIQPAVVDSCKRYTKRGSSTIHLTFTILLWWRKETRSTIIVALSSNASLMVSSPIVQREEDCSERALHVPGRCPSLSCQACDVVSCHWYSRSFGSDWGFSPEKPFLVLSQHRENAVRLVLASTSR